MGVCINYKLGQTKPNVKNTLDQAQRFAEVIKKNIDMSIKIRRENDFTLLIDVQGCETLSFEFKSVKAIMDGGNDGFE